MLGILAKELNLFEKKLLSHPSIAGVIFFYRNYQDKKQFINLISSIQEIRYKYNLPRLITIIDHEGGQVQRLSEPNFTKLPSAAYLGKLYDKDATAALELTKAIATTTAIELGSVGLDLVLGPVVDLAPAKSNSLNKKSRFYHKNPGVINKITEVYINTLQSYGIKAVVKHFPGLAGATKDSHFQINLMGKSLIEMSISDLEPYRYLIKKSNLQAILLSHGIYYKIDKNSVIHSKIWLQEILREQLQFKGIIITDCLQMLGYKPYTKDLVEDSIHALESGCNLILFSQVETNTYQKIYKLISNNYFNNFSQQFDIKNLLNDKSTDYYEKFYSETIEIIKLTYQLSTSNTNKIKFINKSLLKLKKLHRNSIVKNMVILLMKIHYRLRVTFLFCKNLLIP